MPIRRRPAQAVLAVTLALLQTVFAVPMARTVFAQTPVPRVWLGPLKPADAPGSGMITDNFDKSSRTELRKSQQLTVAGAAGPQVVNAGAPDPRVSQAENLRTAGKGLFAKKDYEGALKQLKAALDLYEEALPSVNKLEAVVETLGYLGATSLALEYDGDAQDYFRRVLALVPDSAPLDDYPPAAAALFEKLKGQAAKKKKGSLVVNTTPPGAAVRVDGVERGASPVTVTDLARGEHYVQAASDTAGLGAKKVEIKGGSAQTVEVELSTSVGPEPQKPADPTLVTEINALAAQGQVGAQFREKAEAISEQTKSQYVVVGHVAPQGNNFVLQSFLYGVDQKQVVALDELRFRAELSSVYVQAAAFARNIEAAVVKFPYEKVIVGGLVAVRPVTAPPGDPVPAPASGPDPARNDPPAATARTLRTPDPDPDDDDDAWYTQWWVWTIVGVAVIGGTAYGGYVLLDDGSTPDTFDAKIKW